MKTETTTTEFTPGPWKAGEQRENDASPAHIQIRAYHPGDDAPLKLIAVCYYGETDAERAANARLIESAPDLLAALEGLLRLKCLKVQLGDVPRLVAAARAAIASAKGEA